MKTATREVESLNYLVRILNDRMEGYEIALKEIEPADHDLKTLFSDIIDESREIKLALAAEVQVLGSNIGQGTTMGNKIYRKWLDVKTSFTGKGRDIILSNCESAEEAIQKAYNFVLQAEILAAYIRQMLIAQLVILKKTNCKIKALRNH